MQNSKFLTKKEIKILECAKQHIKKTYKIGLTSIASILLTQKGKIYTGVNLKYKKIWKCVCAERIAIAKAVENNDINFDTIVSVKFDPDNQTYFVVNMCGECRQIAICHRPLKVITDDKSKLKAIPIEKVFPFPYL